MNSICCALKATADIAKGNYQGESVRPQIKGERDEKVGKLVVMCALYEHMCSHLCVCLIHLDNNGLHGCR
jgi:hypothetical protein